MKLPLGITLTFTLLLLLQNFQQASTQILDSWERDNLTVYDNGEQSFNEETPADSTGETDLANVDTQVIPQNSESSSENEGQSFGSVYYNGNKQQDRNPSVTTPMPPAADVLPSNDTEEESSESLPTTTPPSIALNSSSELFDTSELNETETQETAPNTVISEPTQPTHADLNGTYPDPKPENSTGDSSHDETGSGYLPSGVPAEIPTTTKAAHEDNEENVEKTTTVKPSELPTYKTTKAPTPPAIPKIETTAAPDIDDTKTNLNGSFDTRGDLAKDLTSDDVQGKKKGQAWGVILVVGIIVGLIALTAFLILNRRNRRDFSHRKLVEDISPDPVLRLDNSEPLDLKFDGFGYYNPGVQGDNIQMTNFPQGRSN